MDDNGSTKDDVKLPEGEVGDKINQMFTNEGKDCSKSHPPSFQAFRIRTLTFVDVIILTAMGEQACMEVKEAPGAK
jgi:translation initiation factor 5A